MNEHEKKFDLIAHELGISNLIPLVPISRKFIEKALAEGDGYLNTWGNAPWDAKHKAIIALARARYLKFYGIKRFSWSLSNTVCVLKHVAKFYVARKED